MDNFIDTQNATQELSFLRNNDNGVLIQFDCIIYFYYLLTVFHQEFSISKDYYIFHTFNYHFIPYFSTKLCESIDHTYTLKIEHFRPNFFFHPSIFKIFFSYFYKILSLFSYFENPNSKKNYQNKIPSRSNTPISTNVLPTNSFRK